MVHPPVWMWILDTVKRPGKKIRSCRNMVHQTNFENIMDRGEVKWRSNANDWLQKINTQNHQERQLQFFGHVNRADGIEKQILCGKICGTKGRGRQRTKYTDSLNGYATLKESPNNEFIRLQGGLESHDRRCLLQAWHIKKKKKYLCSKAIGKVIVRNGMRTPWPPEDRRT